MNRATDLPALAAKYVALVEEIEDVRQAMLMCFLTDGSGLTGNLAPQASKPNGVHPGPNGADPDPPPAKPRVQVRGRRRVNKFNERTAERKLLSAIEANPGLSAAGLARSTGLARATVGDQVRRMGAQGRIEKDAHGRWRLAGEGARPIEAPSSN
jgi:hypothetical protein